MTPLSYPQITDGYARFYVQRETLSDDSVVFNVMVRGEFDNYSYCETIKFDSSIDERTAANITNALNKAYSSALAKS